ncbi:MAG: AhpC/TSA family protein, partial [Pseudoflavonifractor sp.]
DKLTAAGAKAMVVLQSDPAGLREQIGPESFPYEIICDPDQELYKRYQIAPALSMENMVNLKVLQKIGAATQAGFTHGKYEGNELQLPAVLLVEPGLKVQNVHYAANLSDMPDVDQMLTWLGRKE